MQWITLLLVGLALAIGFALLNPQSTIAQGNCDRSYPDVCIPPAPPDLDCKDIPYRNFRVLQPDPHRFDGDHDGIGCEARKR